MRKNLLLVIATFILLPTFKLRADEGMWLPLLLKNYNYEDMKKKGLKLTPEQLYDVNNSSLKDAIVWFGGGCTGEVISSKGLVLTNHHCGYDAISELSSAADNILDNGFWAKSYKEERPVPGLTVSFVVRMEDITKEVLDSVGSLNEKDRAKRLPSVFKNITSRITKGTHYEAQ
ncbi:MAG: S46 family peptidase, partial [Bacteroidota bacterium]